MATKCYDDKDGKMCQWLDIENFSEGGYCVQGCYRLSEEDINTGCESFEEWE